MVNLKNYCLIYTIGKDYCNTCLLEVKTTHVTEAIFATNWLLLNGTNCTQWSKTRADLLQNINIQRNQAEKQL